MKIQNPHPLFPPLRSDRRGGGLTYALQGVRCFAFCLFTFAFIASAQVKNESSPTPQPLWGDFGLEINNTPGNTPQQNPKIIATADGNFAVAWEDGRDGFTRLFAQKIDHSGNRLWSEVRLQNCGDNPDYGNQNNPGLIDDGSGGAIVVWQGYYSGSADIFIQRISAQGNRLWGEKGVIVCNAAAGQFAPQLISDGAGGAIITWHDYRSGFGEDIYAQRVDANGTPLWGKNGLLICAAAGTQWYPKLCSDGSGGAIIVWTDGRKSSADNNLFAQRVDASGKTLWNKDGALICAAPQNQEKPEIINVENSAVIAWNDSRGGNLDLYAQKIALDGKPLWENDGVAVAAAPYSQQNPRLAPDGKGGAVIVWEDNREEENAVYAQRLSSNGRTVWEENGRWIAKSGAAQENPEILKLNNPDWVVIWEQLQNGAPALFAQKLNGAGIPLWPEGGLRLATAERAQEKASAALSLNGSVMAVWQDKRGGNYDLYAQGLSPDGILSLTEGGVVICDTAGSVIHQNANLQKAGKDEIIVVFEDARSGFINIYAQKIDRDGSLLWGRNAVPLAKIKADQRNAQSASDGAGGAIMVWEDQRNPNFSMLYAQRIASSGKKVWTGGSLVLTKINSRQSKPVIISDRAGGAIIVWEDERNPLSLKDLYGQRISGQGELLWDKNGLRLCAENGDQAEAALVPDGSGGAMLAWADYRRGERNPDIYAQRVGLDGNLLWQKEGVSICSAPDVQKSPSIIKDAEGGAIITWTDKGGGSYDIYTQRVNPEGKTLWITDGIPISQAARTQQNSLIGENQIVVWQDYRYGNWDIFANAVSGQGKLLWGEEGVSVISLPQTQYAQQVIGWTDQGAIIAWEDYRSGKQYEIFLQKLNSSGKAAWQQNGYAVVTADGARAPKLLALPEEHTFIIVWEDYTNGGKALFGQKFMVE